MSAVVVAPGLVQLEAVIERGLQTFVEVGQALLEIRDRRLYREVGYTAFGDYVKTRWGVSRTYAYGLIDASRVTKELSAIEDTQPPANEAQARELVPLFRKDANVAADVWRDLRAEHGDQLTAKDVSQTAGRLVNRMKSLEHQERHPRPVPPPRPEYRPPTATEHALALLRNFARDWEMVLVEGLGDELQELLEVDAHVYVQAEAEEDIKALAERTQQVSDDLWELWLRVREADEEAEGGAA